VIELILINQDRDAYVSFDTGEVLTVAPVVHGRCYFGHNLYCSDTMVGTFDDKKTALNELCKIQTCKDPVYCVRIV
jgi:hypothetical protein